LRPKTNPANSEGLSESKKEKWILRIF